MILLIIIRFRDINIYVCVSCTVQQDAYCCLLLLSFGLLLYGLFALCLVCMNTMDDQVLTTINTILLYGQARNIHRSILNDPTFF